jgi:hypothetical protein
MPNEEETTKSKKTDILKRTIRITTDQNYSWFLLTVTGDLGAIVLRVTSNGYFTKKFGKEVTIDWCSSPIPMDLGYHSIRPMFGGDKIQDCCFLEGKPCYYDGSSLPAIDLWNKFVELGFEETFSEMERLYKTQFKDEEE